MNNIATKISTFLKHIITEKDNETFCPIRLAFILCITGFLGYVGYLVFKTHTIDLNTYATAASTLLGAGGGVVTLKAKASEDSAN